MAWFFHLPLLRDSKRITTKVSYRLLNCYLLQISFYVSFIESVTFNTPTYCLLFTIKYRNNVFFSHWYYCMNMGNIKIVIFTPLLYIIGVAFNYSSPLSCWSCNNFCLITWQLLVHILTFILPKFVETLIIQRYVESKLVLYLLPIYDSNSSI